MLAMKRRSHNRALVEGTESMLFHTVTTDGVLSCEEVFDRMGYNI